MDGSRRLTTGGRFSAAIFAAVVALHSFPRFASALPDSVNTEWLSTGRALGMGNAGIATADDPSTAMFYNPAALSGNRRLAFEFFNPQFEFSTSNFDVAPSLQSQGKLIGLKKTVPLLNNHRGRPVHLGFSIYPNISAKNFAMGILYRAEGGAYINDLGQLKIRSQYMLIPTLALTVGAVGGLFKMGFAVRGVQLAVNERTVDNAVTSTEEIGYTAGASEGFGLGADFGALLTLPWKTLPAFAFVARNIGGTSLGGAPLSGFATGNVQDGVLVPMMFDVGFSIQPKLGQTTVLKLACDYRDLHNKSHTNMGRKFNAGFELGFRRKLYLRGGYSQGYWTAGFGLAGKDGSLDLAVYGEELHPTGFKVMEDRRFMLGYGGRF